ncbi:hypothetical protein EUTSA_v10028170mg [Eutrema salsugineum]|uniref:FAS1 domain-containing protein n=1 Tax=Eutrema salsugineum TaxID=72664 RepID=V4L8W9_EUTSA|nr:putative fasciclin-like arabinogalactan protein 20 [Eutrema salsugineum]ESQ46865.1 hypothetical protein EUTSA_v10028170mg [Eutrema salsugineum]
MASKIFATFFLPFFFLDLVSLSDASLTPISSAVEVLSSESTHFSMGLTLQLANQDLSLEDWQELTIFAPSDQAFSTFGQPSLLDIKYQLSPARLPVESLKNLLPGAKIPTLRSDSSLIVTNSSRSGGKTSINDVEVQDSPLFDDGYVVIYSSDEFFTAPMTEETSLNSSSSSSIPNSISSPPSIPIPSSATRTPPSHNFAGSTKTFPNKTKPASCFNIFESASSLLFSRGFVIMATFLALQLETSENDTKLTVFAPIDEAIPNSISKFSDYATIFRGHVIRKLLSWKDLQKLAWEGSILQTALKGYEIELSWSGDVLLLNGVPLIYPDMYANEWVAVHGVNQMIAPQAMQPKLGESISELNGGEEEDDVHQEYSSELGDYGLH